MPILWIVLGAVALVAVYVIATYNGLITLKNRVEEAESDIDVQLKRQADLIPNLVNSVKGFFKQEKGIFDKITDARGGLTKGTMAEKLAANDQLGGALKSLFMLTESNPAITSSSNVAQLQADILDAQDKIMSARRFYNGNVRDFNTKIQVFPTNLYGQMLGFKPYEFIEATEADKATPVVDL